METVMVIDEDIHEDFSNAIDIVRKARPTWSSSEILTKELTAGITNKILLLYQKEDPKWENAVLIRRYGENTHHIIDRKAEQRNMLVLHSVGSCRPLYAVLKNALVYGFVPGKTTDEITIIHPTIRALMAKEMAKLHTIDLSSYPGFDTSHPSLLGKLETFFKAVPNTFSDPDMQKRWESYGHSLKNLKEETYLVMETIAKHATSPLGFCHNDALLENVVYNEDCQTLNVIDYEYGDYNYTYFDIANHFNEHAGVATVDYNRYPTREYQKDWMTIYLNHYYQYSSDKNSELSSLSDANLDRICDEINLFSLASNLFWGVWALVQAVNSKIDFDFMDYAFTRLNRYFETKKPFMSPYLNGISE